MSARSITSGGSCSSEREAVLGKNLVRKTPRYYRNGVNRKTPRRQFPVNGVMPSSGDGELPRGGSDDEDERRKEEEEREEAKRLEEEKKKKEEQDRHDKEQKEKELKEKEQKEKELKEKEQKEKELKEKEQKEKELKEKEQKEKELKEKEQKEKELKEKEQKEKELKEKELKEKELKEKELKEKELKEKEQKEKELEEKEQKEKEEAARRAEKKAELKKKKQEKEEQAKAEQARKEQEALQLEKEREEEEARAAKRHQRELEEQKRKEQEAEKARKQQEAELLAAKSYPSGSHQSKAAAAPSSNIVSSAAHGMEFKTPDEQLMAEEKAARRLAHAKEMASRGKKDAARAKVEVAKAKKENSNAKDEADLVHHELEKVQHAVVKAEDDAIKVKQGSHKPYDVVAKSREELVVATRNTAKAKEQAALAKQVAAQAHAEASRVQEEASCAGREASAAKQELPGKIKTIDAHGGDEGLVKSYEATVKTKIDRAAFLQERASLVAERAAALDQVAHDRNEIFRAKQEIGKHKHNQVENAVQAMQLSKSLGHDKPMGYAAGGSNYGDSQLPGAHSSGSPHSTSRGPSPRHADHIQGRGSPVDQNAPYDRSAAPDSGLDAHLHSRMEAVQQRCEQTVSQLNKDVVNLSSELARVNAELQNERERCRNLEQLRTQHELDINGLSNELRSLTVDMRDTSRRQRHMEEQDMSLQSILNELGVDDVNGILPAFRALRERICSVDNVARNQQQQLQWANQAGSHLQQKCRTLEAELEAARKARWQADMSRMKVEEDRELIKHELAGANLHISELDARVTHLNEQYLAITSQADVLGRAVVRSDGAPAVLPRAIPTGGISTLPKPQRIEPVRQPKPVETGGSYRPPPRTDAKQAVQEVATTASARAAGTPEHLVLAPIAKTQRAPVQTGPRSPRQPSGQSNLGARRVLQGRQVNGTQRQRDIESPRRRPGNTSSTRSGYASPSRTRQVNVDVRVKR